MKSRSSYLRLGLGSVWNLQSDCTCRRRRHDAVGSSRLFLCERNAAIRLRSIVRHPPSSSGGNSAQQRPHRWD